MMRVLKTFLMLFIFCGSLMAQVKSAKEHVRMGEELYANEEYGAAADHFFKAWELKPNKYSWLYQSGLAYHYISDYANASKVFSILKENSSKFEDAQLLLARNLKNEGKYEEASKEFLDYIYEYKGDDKEELSAQLQQEIRGCELGMQMKNADFDSGVEISRIDQNVNSIADESNPIPFDMNILYFVSDFTGSSKFYRTEYSGGNWEKAVDPPLFPMIDGMDIKNGSFAPDFKRFYFNQCVDSEEEYGQCDLYFIIKDGDRWSEPQKMKKYINVPGTSNMHPHVVYLDDKEIIYFSSNRSGGHGGLDLWYIVRDRTSDVTEYTFPTNLGKAINSSGDEIAPNYKMNEGRLYYSSNGKVTMGGFDVFRAKGSEAFWESAENVGIPINSSGDDFQISWNVGGSMGYVVSNRPDSKKATTTEYDIFAFKTGKVSDKLLLVGSIYDESSKRLIQDATMALFEYHEGKNQLVQKLQSPKGDFKFWLEPDKDYVLKTTKENYLKKESRFSTSNLGGAVEFEQNIYVVEGVESTDTPPASEDQRVASSSRPQVAQQAPANDGVVQPTRTQTPPKKATIQKISESKVQKFPEPRTSSVEIEPVNNKTVKITQDGSSTAPISGDGSRVSGNTSYQSSSSTQNGQIIDARPVDPKRAEIVTTGRPSSVTYPTSTSNNNNASYYGRSDHSEVSSGVYYKVQICSVSQFNSSNPAFNPVRSLGSIDTEYLSGRNLTRVLVGNYSSRSQAEEAARTAKSGGFPGAFVVEYLDGRRLN